MNSNMNENEIPIVKKVHDLYKTFHDYRRVIPKQDRFTIYERSENTILIILECVLEAGYSKQVNKTAVLDKASVKLNILRFFVRTLKETKAIDIKKYIILQEMINEIGRMLGGWIRSTDRPLVTKGTL